MSKDPVRLARADAYVVRAALFQALPETLSAFGLRIEPLLREAGLAPDSLDDPERPIPVRAAVKLVALGAERTGRSDFGLLAGQTVPLAALGLIGMLAANATDVGTGLRGLVMTLHLNGRAIVPALVVRDGMASLSLALATTHPAGMRQAIDFAMAIAGNIMRTLCGPDWVPGEVLFSYRPPADQKSYARFFKAPLQFNADHSALVFPATWLSRRIAGASTQRRQALQQGVAAVMSQQPFDILTRTRRAVFTAIVQDDVRVENVAGLLGMHRRTLNLRLAENDTTLAGILNEVRFEIARRLMSDTALPLVNIAATLNYADASAFTRAFRSWSGMTPTEWRRKGSRQRT
jgi:AraC-like DNA-binding protein